MVPESSDASIRSRPASVSEMGSVGDLPPSGLRLVPQERREDDQIIRIAGMRMWCCVVAALSRIRKPALIG